MKPARVRARSIFGQLTTASILIAVIAVGVLFAVTTITVQRQTRSSLSATVSTDLAGLIDIYATAGREELLRRVADRQDVVSLEGRRSHYMIADGAGRLLAGDVKHWPELNAARSEEGFVTLGDGTQVYAQGAKLAPNLQLLVAREYDRDRSALAVLSAAFLAVGAAIVGAVAFVAWITARHLARRMDAVNAALGAAADGRAASFPARQRGGDEIDEVAGHGARLLARQAQLLKAYKQVSEHVAHEVRTPLMHLDNRLGTAMQARPEGAGGPIGQSREDIRTILSMLDSLLDIASAESRRGDLAGLAEIDMSALVTSLADLYEGSAEDAGLTFETSIAKNVTMLGERMQITRLLSNLLDNAIKYVPEGGRVRLILRAGPQVTVEDDGPGILRDQRDRIFERFARATAPGDRPGHGLGLALSRAIAERHGLVLRLGDAPRGAQFILEPAP
ncbi:sensor histidine kinase [Novosphingobium taihuense]|uniref:histidine kinase n=1 Tax=Novosphingobium taihuense TaxID=260085 RepID=A0A7W7ET18_9SPHN|nr:HAMP domain-containing sensor histidine kinase [Novosphingobium taihuense]MBB4612797.1 signal transduction histidine kinase [Novosphingobium taihuense]TWH80292.1 signal transduction histidine kinase [Novosphingobium taihuense]